MIPGHIFREYDIRGLHETELTNETAEAVGHAFATVIKREGGTRVAIGPVSYAGVGPTDDEARGSALRLAASSAAQELSSRMTTMGIR